MGTFWSSRTVWFVMISNARGVSRITSEMRVRCMSMIFAFGLAMFWKLFVFRAVLKDNMRILCYDFLLIGDINGDTFSVIPVCYTLALILPCTNFPPQPIQLIFIPPKESIVMLPVWQPFSEILIGFGVYLGLMRDLVEAEESPSWRRWVVWMTSTYLGFPDPPIGAHGLLHCCRRLTRLSRFVFGSVSFCC